MRIPELGCRRAKFMKGSINPGEDNANFVSPRGRLGGQQTANGGDDILVALDSSVAPERAPQEAGQSRISINRSRVRPATKLRPGNG